MKKVEETFSRILHHKKNQRNAKWVISGPTEALPHKPMVTGRLHRSRSVDLEEGKSSDEKRSSDDEQDYSTVDLEGKRDLRKRANSCYGSMSAKDSAEAKEYDTKLPLSARFEPIDKKQKSKIEKERKRLEKEEKRKKKEEEAQRRRKKKADDLRNKQKKEFKIELLPETFKKVDGMSASTFARENEVVDKVPPSAPKAPPQIKTDVPAGDGPKKPEQPKPQPASSNPFLTLRGGRPFWEIEFTELELNQKIGQGGVATVYKGCGYNF